MKNFLLLFCLFFTSTFASGNTTIETESYGPAKRLCLEKAQETSPHTQEEDLPAGPAQPIIQTSPLLKKIPLEIMSRIMLFLDDIKDVHTCKRVCKDFYRAATYNHGSGKSIPILANPAPSTITLFTVGMSVYLTSPNSLQIFNRRGEITTTTPLAELIQRGKFLKASKILCTEEREEDHSSLKLYDITDATEVWKKSFERKVFLNTPYYYNPLNKFFLPHSNGCTVVTKKSDGSYSDHTHLIPSYLQIQEFFTDTSGTLFTRRGTEDNGFCFSRLDPDSFLFSDIHFGPYRYEQSPFVCTPERWILSGRCPISGRANITEYDMTATPPKIIRQSLLEVGHITFPQEKNGSYYFTGSKFIFDLDASGKLFKLTPQPDGFELDIATTDFIAGIGACDAQILGNYLLLSSSYQDLRLVNLERPTQIYVFPKTSTSMKPVYKHGKIWLSEGKYIDVKKWF